MIYMIYIIQKFSEASIHKDKDIDRGIVCGDRIGGNLSVHQ